MNKFLFLCSLSIVCFLPLPGKAQEPDFEASYEGKKETLKHESLTLGISPPKKSFFLGELIPVTFRFKDRETAGQYSVWTGGYDRSGRIPSVSFFVDADSESAKDPLAVYFTSAIFAGGGLGNIHELGEFEQVFHLNEWVRFEKPGTYRLYATSKRVSGKMDAPPLRNPELVSQMVEIEIREPTEKELAQTFSEAEASFTPDDYKKRDETYDALSRIRHLDSKQSRLRLRSMLGEGNGAEFTAMFGLIGTREVDETIKLLEEGISDPEVAVTQNYLNALSRLRHTEKFYEQTAEEQKKPRFTGGFFTMDYRGMPEDWQFLVDSFHLKTGRAKAVCALSLFRLILGEQRQAESAAENSKKGILTVEQKPIIDRNAASAEIKEPLAEVFNELGKEEQKLLLKDSWELIKSQAMIEPLRKIVETPMKSAEYARSNGIHSWALLRYAEMKPDIAHPIILEEIRKPRPMFSLPPLRQLPGELAQADLELLVEHLSLQGSDVERIAGLIEHYGDDTIYDPVKRYYLGKEGRWACAIQTYLLNYLIQINRKEGLDMTFRALKLRENTGCYRSSVINVLTENYDKKLEPRVIAAFLTEQEPDVIVNFLRMLKAHESKEAIDAILTHLERLDPVAVDDDYSYDTEAGAHKEIRKILLRKVASDVRYNDGVQWKLLPDQLDRLKANLITEDEKAEFTKNVLEEN